MGNSVIYHPFLIALFPFLFIISHNVGQVSYRSVATSLVLVIGVTALTFYILRLAVKDCHKAGAILTCILIAFFTYGHVFSAVEYVNVWGVDIGRHRYFMTIWLIILTISIITIITRRESFKLTKVMNIFCLSLIVVPIMQISYHTASKMLNKSSKIYAEGESNKQMNESDNSIIIATKTGLVKRDIYYIIPDMYAGSEVLRDIYGYDNNDFTEYLRTKGFHVVNNAKSNYGSTIVSLPSSLNMEYVNNLKYDVGEESEDPTISNRMICQNRMVDYLRKHGYLFINIGSSLEPTDYIKEADMNIHCGALNEFNSILVKTTLLNPFMKVFVDRQREHILCSFVKLNEMPLVKGPKFVLAHMVTPHYPFIFGRNGEIVEDSTLDLRDDRAIIKDRKKKYIDQLVYVNKKLKSVIEHILAKSTVEPIIIIQADHGPSMTGIGDQWINPSPDMIREKMSILNALYLPSVSEEIIYNGITPVNIFRIVLNEYFNENMSILEDRIYYSHDHTPFMFIEVKN